MSVARNASATTSLPNPAALTPAGTGRSKADNVLPLAGRVFALSLLLLDTVSAGPLPPGGRNGGIQPDYEPCCQSFRHPYFPLFFNALPSPQLEQMVKLAPNWHPMIPKLR